MIQFVIGSIIIAILESYCCHATKINKSNSSSSLYLEQTNHYVHPNSWFL